MEIGSKDEIISAIEKHDSIVVFHHIRPDGDCLGSQFGLANLIKLNLENKKVYVVGDSKNSFDFLNLQHDDISNVDFQNALAIIVDANFKERIEFAHLLEQIPFKKILRIDHHPNDDDLGQNTIRWVDSSYIASAEQIAFLAMEEKLKLDQNTSSYIYLGILTDSGRFKFSNTSARTHKCVSYLFQNGLDHNFVSSNLDKKKLDDLKFNSYIIKNAQTDKNVIYYTLNLQEIKELNKSPLEVARPNILANIIGYPVWISFTEEEDEKIRIEFRSSGVDVSKVAKIFNGGGHVQASGAILKGTIENQRQNILKVIEECNKLFD